jgi:hypothetical protein
MILGDDSLVAEVRSRLGGLTPTTIRTPVEPSPAERADRPEGPGLVELVEGEYLGPEDGPPFIDWTFEEWKRTR